MSVTTAAPPKPRISVLDVVRGVAVMGILMANIAAFSEPIFAREIGPQIGLHYEPSRSMYDALLTALVAGKFRGMLAVMFGIGLMMQYQRREAAGEKWPGSYLRRTIFLLILGLIHALFIWYGDILTAYAIAAGCMMLFAKVGDKTLKWIVIGGLGYGLLVGLFAVLGDYMRSPDSGGADMMKDLMERAPILKLWLTPAGETQAYQSGSYGIQFLHRLGIAGMGAFNHLILLPYYGALFAFGMLIARSRVWEDKERLAKGVRIGMLVGFGVGLPLNLLSIPMTLSGHGEGASGIVEISFSAVLCLGYLSLLAWLGMKAPGLMRPFENVGRTALTCYLLTSVLATTIYYSYGFARFGRTTNLEDWFVIFGIWGVLLGFAWVWTRVFEYGPVEWAWRSASLGRKLPFRRARAIERVG